MDGWRGRLKADATDWLLQSDSDNRGVRYLALIHLLDRSADGPEVVAAQRAIMESGPVPAILAAQHSDGYWVKPGPGYGPKYQGTFWQVVFLGQLGADGADRRVRAACEYVLTHNTCRYGWVSVNGTPSAFIHCMAGNLIASLIDLGWLDDGRVQLALEWLARFVTGDGVADADATGAAERFYKSGTCGPLFACSANGKLPCAWGAVKALLALSKVPPSQRTPAVQAAIERGADFLLSRDPAVADYPFAYGNRPNSSWFKFGYPIGYVTDVLQNIEVLAALGHAKDPRLARALEMVEGKQDAAGRWRLEYAYNGKTWADIERKGAPSKWVTLRALRVLKAAYGGS